MSSNKDNHKGATERKSRWAKSFQYTAPCFAFVEVRKAQTPPRGLLQMHKQTSIILIRIIIEKELKSWPYQSHFKIFLFSSTSHSKNTNSSNFKIKRGWQKQQFRIGVVWDWEALCDGFEHSWNHNFTSNVGVSPQPDILQGRHLKQNYPKNMNSAWNSFSFWGKYGISACCSYLCLCVHTLRWARMLN